uniref:Uncharacterized protein ZK673.1-like n=1 Tax=Crassostrea virginica TaxID=6565 RepID=A0A8B8AFL0_CRAVI|nr:uncharacterized protein ZK673.1-like [Crassostrea virginica]
MEKLILLTIVSCFLMCFFKTGNSQSNDWCKDSPELNCWRYIDAKCLAFYEDWARAHCPFRCGYCPNKPPCEDTDTSCGSYHHGSCTAPDTRAYMREHCRKTCNECSYPGDDHPPNTPPPGVTIETTPATDPAVKPPVGK